MDYSGAPGIPGVAGRRSHQMPRRFPEEVGFQCRDIRYGAQRALGAFIKRFGIEVIGVYQCGEQKTDPESKLGGIGIDPAGYGP